jgi:hypothetical protein
MFGVVSVDGEAGGDEAGGSCIIGTIGCTLPRRVASARRAAPLMMRLAAATRSRSRSL